MIGTKLSNHEIAQLAAGLAVIAAFLIWLIAAVITGIISFFSPDWGCYACGWRGRRRQIYRPDAFKMNFSGLPSVAKWILSLCMLMGRLELYAILIILNPNFWLSR